jgi:hypothetical protein
MLSFLFSCCRPTLRIPHVSSRVVAGLAAAALSWGFVGCGKPKRMKFIPPAAPEEQLSLKDIGVRHGVASDLLLAGKFEDAADRFGRLRRQKQTGEPYRSWLTVQEALALILAGKDAEAQTLLKGLSEHPWKGNDAVPSEGRLSKFFVTLAETVGRAGVVSPEVSKDYDKEGYEAIALFLYGAKNWNLEKYEEATSLLLEFSDSKVNAPKQWLGTEEQLKKLRAMAGEFESGLDEYKRARAKIDAATEPDEKKAAVEYAVAALPKMRVLGKQTAALKEQIITVGGEATMALALKARETAENEEFDAEALPAALKKRGELLAQLRFREALDLMKALELRTEKAREQQDVFLIRTQWLDTFKSNLIEDLTAKGYAAPVKLKKGAPLEGGVAMSNEQGLQIKTKPEPTPVPWANVAPETLFAMAQSFIPADLPPLLAAHRKWHLGVYAAFIGNLAESKKLTAEAAEMNEVFKEALLSLPSELR